MPAGNGRLFYCIIPGAPVSPKGCFSLSLSLRKRPECLYIQFAAASINTLVKSPVPAVDTPAVYVTIDLHLNFQQAAEVFYPRKIKLILLEVLVS